MFLLKFCSVSIMPVLGQYVLNRRPRIVVGVVAAGSDVCVMLLALPSVCKRGVSSKGLCSSMALESLSCCERVAALSGSALLCLVLYQVCLRHGACSSDTWHAGWFCLTLTA